MTLWDWGLAHGQALAQGSHSHYKGPRPLGPLAQGLSDAITRDLGLPGPLPGPFLMQLQGIWALGGVPEGSRDPKSGYNCIRGGLGPPKPGFDPFWTTFWPIFGPILGPLFGPKVPLLPIKPLKKGSKNGPKNGPKMGPKWVQNGVPGPPFGPLFDPLLTGSGPILGGKRGDLALCICGYPLMTRPKNPVFGPLFGPFLDPFLTPFWTHYGQI